MTVGETYPQIPTGNQLLVTIFLILNLSGKRIAEEGVRKETQLGDRGHSSAGSVWGHIMDELTPSSFSDKFSPQLVQFLRPRMQDPLARFAITPLPGKLGELFKDISIFENTVVTFCKSLTP